MTQLRGKKVQDVYTKVYNVRETAFSNQTGQFPKRSLRGNKYVMVLVKIDSNAIMVAPLKSRHANKLKQAYQLLISRLHPVGIVPKKHVFDNEVLENTKEMIRDQYHMTMELVPPGCHHRNTAEVAI